MLARSRGGVNDGSNPLAGLIMDSAGSLYGTTQFGGGNDQGTVFEITAAGNETVCTPSRAAQTTGYTRRRV